MLRTWITPVVRYSTKAMNLKPVTHVIFDMDGVLLNTEEIYEKADSQMAAKYGKTYTMDVRMKVLGRTENRAAQIIIEELQLPISVEQFRVEVNQILDTMLKDASLMDGAEMLVKHFHQHKVPIAIATSSGEKGVRAKTSKHRKFIRLFNHIVMASSDSEVKHGKPAPDVFLICAQRFPDKPNPENCLVFEDAPNGVTAALKANMQVVMIPENYVGEEDRKRATLVINSLKEFKPELFGLPAFTS